MIPGRVLESTCPTDPGPLEWEADLYLPSVSIILVFRTPVALLSSWVLLLCLQHSFPEPSMWYLDLILAILALELICSLTCLLVYTGEHDKEPVNTEKGL